MTKTVDGIWFSLYLRKLVAGTPAVVNSIFDDIKYNSEKDEIKCVLYDIDGLSKVIEGLQQECPCKIVVEWK